MERIYAFPPDVVQHAKFIGTSSAKTRVAKAVVPVVTHKGVIAGVKRGGRRVSWTGGGKKGKLRVSGSKTEIFIGPVATASFSRRSCVRSFTSWFKACSNRGEIP